MYNANSNHVVLEIEKGEDIVIKDGIIVSDKSTENSKLIHGKITSVGPKVKNGFEVDQVVLYDKYSINKINSDLGVLKEDNIILIEK